MLIAQISDMHVKPPGELLYKRIDTTGFLDRALDGAPGDSGSSREDAPFADDGAARYGASPVAARHGPRDTRQLHRNLQGSGAVPNAAMTVAPSQPTSRWSLQALFKKLGPGVITGAADDDPSGIATYSQAGARAGFGLLWTVVRQ